MALLSIFLPLISAICAGVFPWFIGRSGASYLSTSMMFLNVGLTLVLFNIVCFGQKAYNVVIGSWIYSDSFQVDWGFYFDSLTVTILFVVNIISALVHLYSLDYMENDPHLARFMSYLSLFTFFMILLVTGKNFVILFLGWEGVGLCSYLLISFWFTRIQANKAAIKALIVNRVADFALIIGMVAVFFTFKSLDFNVIFPLIPFFTTLTITFLGFNVKILNLICILLFIGAMGKSAQIGLHTWLPDAMEGPTPVSALIHAATMVTAGVFLIIKCSFIFEYVPCVLGFICFIGGLTAFFSGTVALVQYDIKKVIAYSTCSQLGYMVFACGLSHYQVGLFHLVNHAFFKALLFLAAGAIIHSLSNEQDMRKFGNLLSFLPFTAMMMLIGSLSLMGFPFLSGFYSKDLVLELAWTTYTEEGFFVCLLGLVTAWFTALYSFRLFYYTFLRNHNSFLITIRYIHEVPWKMALVLGVLSIGSIFFGFFFREIFVGVGADFFNFSILLLPEHNNLIDAEFIVGLPVDDWMEIKWIGELEPGVWWGQGEMHYDYWGRIPRLIKYGPLFCIFFGAWVLYLLVHPERHWFVYMLGHPKFWMGYIIQWIFRSNIPGLALVDPRPRPKRRRIGWWLLSVWASEAYIEHCAQIGRIISVSQSDRDKLIRFCLRLYKFALGKWYFDNVYNEYLNRPLLEFAHNTIFTGFDKGLLELFGPYGISSVLFTLAFRFKKMQFGRIYYYAYFMIIFLFLSLTLLALFS